MLRQLREEYDSTGRSELFENLAGQLSGTTADGVLTDLATRLEMSPESVRVALHRLRKRYRLLLRNEISHTTNSPEEIDDEIRQLFEVLAGR